MPSSATTHFNLTTLCREGQLKEALHILLTAHNPPIDSSTYIKILQTCILNNALSQGKVVHSFVAHRRFALATRTTSHNKLIYMYAKCGSLVHARKVFDHMNERDNVSWNTIIAAYRRHGYPHETVTLFHQMQQTGFQPDQFTFASVLPACAEMGALEQGIDIHRTIKDRGISLNVVVATALVDMYAKCGSIGKARELFDQMPQRNVVSWNVMIVGYAHIGFVENALETFKQMQLAGVKPDLTTFASILPACAKMEALEQGMDIHQSIKDRGISSNIVVASSLVDMYAKCGRIDKAHEVFDKMPQRDVVSWNAMIAGYAQNGFVEKALDTFKQMQLEGYAQNEYVEKALETFKQMQLVGVKPNSRTFASSLSACAKMGAMELGIEIHRSIMEGEFLSDIIVGNALVDMYAKCGRIDKVHGLFDKMHKRDVISWTGMIAGYAQNGFVGKALKTLKQMQLAGVKPNSTTFASILPACAKMGALELGMNIHQSILEGGLLTDIIVGNALVDMYAKCGRIDKAYELFDRMPQRDVFSWNAMILGYAQNELVEKALKTFKQMQLAGVKPDSTTFANILSACAKMGALELGMAIHQSIMDRGILSNVVVSTALMDMYAKCGSIDKACELFDKMPQKDVISWNTMIAGYTQNGFVEKALETFKQMQLAGIKEDSTTFASILPACAKMGALEQGMDIHQSINDRGISSDVVVATALVDMYAKCGSIGKARELFDKMSQRNVVSWNAMIVGYAQNGFCKDALKVFELMKHSGTYPDIISFACILCACSHAGLVDEGCTYFNHMSDFYCITPTVDHYVYMVDLLARSGYLEDTLKFIIKMPVKPVVVVWMCFLGACRLHMNIGLGVYTAILLFDLDPKNAATYVLLSNIYAEAGRWGEVQMLRRLMKDEGMKKIPGCSWIECHKVVHAFCAGDRSHPQTQEIYAKLEKLAWEMKAAGYFPDSKHLLNDVEEEEKELFLCHHSEKLAIAFGLLNMPFGTTIRVVKNLRVCADCHTATKFISKIVAREIVVRDANRFHHFKQGQCSCGDYW
ncbi:pentatricopeptide repeat-containing protein At2g03880, mitochondrial-like [Cryptomeria japonica]|uniref:pentatricopeptide repeat-containing protein At2g03880, mitochondrial-like n=1 Tax=Cryptomeria japonica TaxID=3369 RepID=UPI0027DA0094|nr:pentatricopeptide repeat-containing protein At2g03880, mitochondrial-like [Cryptomeria japonica]